MKQHRHQKKPVTFLARHRHLLRWSAGIIVVLVVLQLGVWAAFQLSPWPNALLIRHAFDDNSGKVSRALQKYVPNTVVQIENQSYRSGDKDALLDKIKEKIPELRRKLGNRIAKQVRVVPELIFYLDDSIDYAEHINKLLKK